jgi:osmotically-inducible protein OsmY
MKQFFHSEREKMILKNQWLHGILFFAAFGLVSVVGAPAASAQEGLGERIGQRLDRGIEQLGDQLKEGWQSLRQTVDKMGVQGRVYARLKWDKHLEKSEIEVDVEGEGVVILKGVVPTEKAKSKAVALTEDTIGVTRVVTNLNVATVAAPNPRD